MNAKVTHLIDTFINDQEPQEISGHTNHHKAPINANSMNLKSKFHTPVNPKTAENVFIVDMPQHQL